MPSGSVNIYNFRDQEIIIEPSCDTSALSTNDIIATTELVDLQTVSSNKQTRAGRITGIQILDKDDQGQDIEVFFLKDDTSLGTENSGVSISDADAEKIIGSVTVSEWSNGIGWQLGQSFPIEMPFVTGTDNSNQLGVAFVCRGGTPTYTASGLYVRIFAQLQE